jgi:hypothetical protein
MFEDIEANHQIQGSVRQMRQGLPTFALRHRAAAVAPSQANLRWAKLHSCDLGKPKMLQGHNKFTLASAKIQSFLASAG